MMKVGVRPRANGRMRHDLGRLSLCGVLAARPTRALFTPTPHISIPALRTCVVCVQPTCNTASWCHRFTSSNFYNRSGSWQRYTHWRHTQPYVSATSRLPPYATSRMTSGYKADRRWPQLNITECIEAWQSVVENDCTVRHTMFFDSSCMHHAPLHSGSKPSRTASKPTRLLHDASREDTRAEEKGDEMRDVPPLSPNEYRDPEDEIDAAKFSQYNKDSNFWLICMALFALLNTLFLTKMTIVHRQRQVVRNAKAYLESLPGVEPMLPQIQQQFHESFGLAMLQQTPEETWVPLLWYTSLILAVMGTFAVLLIKNWLMRCSLMLYAPWTSQELGGPPSEHEWGKSEALKAAQIKRMQEFKRARKDAIERTERVWWVPLILLWTAVVVFIAGLIGKMWTMIFMSG